MKVYITKYALSAGIEEKEVEQSSDTMVAERKGSHLSAFYHKPYWHPTKEEAVAHAEKLRLDKIASLQKQISKLDKMKF